jgi:AmmeMemoRadiSam system protein A
MPGVIYSLTHLLSGTGGMPLNESEKTYLLNLARRGIEAHLADEPLNDEGFESDAFELNCGAFVTLKIGGALRGCIGNIRASKPLRHTVREMAVAAATRDPRFPPMRRAELDRAHIEISALSPFERISNTDEIVAGTHGLYIKKGAYSGLLLPQVAVEWNWDRRTFLEHTCGKAGLPADAYNDPDIEIYIFTAEVFGEHENDA